MRCPSIIQVYLVHAKCYHYKKERGKGNKEGGEQRRKRKEKKVKSKRKGEKIRKEENPVIRKR